MTNSLKTIEEDLKILPGAGATETVGSDKYPYYVAEVLPNGVIGMYQPGSHFKSSWADGTMEVDPFDPQHKPTTYIKRRYGKWWATTRTGIPIRPFTSRYAHLSFNGAYSYQDPSF